MPNDFTREEGELVGAIRPAPDDGAPLFRIIRRDGFESRLGEGEENVRPCDHPNFTLDERWSTVTCRACKQTVNPFDALMRYAVWYEKLKREQQTVEHAERGLQVARLHRLKTRRALTDPERNEVLEAIRTQYAAKAKDLGNLAGRIEKVLRERLDNRRRARASRV